MASQVFERKSQPPPASWRINSFAQASHPQLKSPLARMVVLEDQRKRYSNVLPPPKPSFVKLKPSLTTSQYLPPVLSKDGSLREQPPMVILCTPSKADSAPKRSKGLRKASALLSWAHVLPYPRTVGCSLTSALFQPKTTGATYGHRATSMMPSRRTNASRASVSPSLHDGYMMTLSWAPWTKPPLLSHILMTPPLPS